MPAPGLPAFPVAKAPVRDDFETADLAFCWNFLRNPRPADWSLSERPGWLTLHGSEVSLDEADSPAFVARRQQHFECEATVCVEFDPIGDHEEAGLTVIMNEQHHYEIAIVRHEGQRHVAFKRRIGSMANVEAMRPLPPGPVQLRISAMPNSYAFSCAVPGGEFEVLGEGEARYLSSEVAGGFTGVYVGMYATGNGKRCQAPAQFDWFDYEGTNAPLPK